MNHSHQSSLLPTDTAAVGGYLGFKQTLAYIEEVQRRARKESEEFKAAVVPDPGPVPSFIFLPEQNMSNKTPAAAPDTQTRRPGPGHGRGGNGRDGAYNFSNTEVMDMLRTLEKILPIGTEDGRLSRQRMRRSIH